MSLLEIGQKPIDNDNAKVKELETRVLALETNSAKKNQANTFTQPQTFRNSVEFGTTIKAGFGANVVNITPEDDSNKTLSIQRFDINMNNKKITGVANPTSNTDATNKAYVDGLAQGVAKTNVANTFTANQKIDNATLELRANQETLKLGNKTGNAPNYIGFYNANNRRAYLGFGSNNSQVFEINNGNADIKLVGNQINVDNKKIVNVATPTNNNDVANKQYVDTKNTEQSNTINNQLNQIQGVMQQQGDNITTMNNEITKNRTRNQEQDVNIQELQKKVRALENIPPGSPTLVYSKRLNLALTHSTNIFTNVGGLDVDEYTVDVINMIPINTYITSVLSYYSFNGVVLSVSKYTNTTYKLVIAKQTGTTLPPTYNCLIDYITVK